MKIEILQLELITYASETELPVDDQALLLKAKEAAVQAYAPYSKFKVGAAVLLSNGLVITGNNQENAAYPSGLCAERVALYFANAAYPDQTVEAIAITAIGSISVIKEPISPCGACRQVMAEYENKSKKPMRVILQGQEGAVLVLPAMKHLLPFSFTDDTLFKYAQL